MTIETVQGVCALVLGIAYALAIYASDDRPGFVRDALLIGISAWVGEETCIQAYGFYGYADGWWPMVDHVPLLVVAIWPMVVLSARGVVDSLWPGLAPRSRALLVVVAVVLDASLMEIVAVEKGLWTWTEPGYFHVPIIGLLGWGFFAGAASWWIDRGQRSPRWMGIMPVVTTFATHLLLVAFWQGGMRYVLHEELGLAGLWGAAAVVGAITVPVALARRRGAPGISRITTAQRVIAASVFFALLIEMGWRGDRLGLWIHTAIVSVPYLVAMQWRAAPAAASTAASRAEAQEPSGP